jgi:hypothetical protein
MMVLVGSGEFMFSSKCLLLLLFILHEMRHVRDSRPQLNTDRSVMQSGWPENILLLSERSVKVTFRNFTSVFSILF